MEILKEVSFKELDKWFVSFYLNPYTIESIYQLINLSEVIYPRKDRISKKDYKNNIPVIKKISFKDGRIHLRDKNETGMDLYKISKNELLVSKINFHQGAISINNIGELVCSTHYQPYIINETIIRKDYLTFCLRSDSFLNFIKYLRADGIKNEATYEFIGKLKIPLPPLEEQNRIVANYNTKIQLANKQEVKAKQLEQEIEIYLFEKLGIEKLAEIKQIKLFRTIGFKEVDRWAVDSLGRVSKIEERFRGKYPLVKLRELINSYQYGLSEKSSIEKIGYSMLRMNNINNSELDLSKLKYISIDNKIFNKYKLNYGDLLFNRTNSKELVGKTAIFNSKKDFTFASYLIRVVVNIKKVDINYINYLFNSTILGYQKNLVSRQITGQANINAQEMQDFLFPLPPLKIQNQIANHISSLKQQIKDLQSQAKENIKKAINEFEQEIFTNS